MILKNRHIFTSKFPEFISNNKLSLTTFLQPDDLPPKEYGSELF